MIRETIEVDSSFFEELDKWFEYNNIPICTSTKSKGFNVIEKKQDTNYDDDGNTIKFVVQRVEDGLFFKGEYEKWPGSGEVEMLDEELEQVFPVEKKVIVYE